MMSRHARTIIAMLLLVFASATTTAFGARENEGEVREFAGRLSVQGSEPHTVLALSTADRVFRVVGPLQDRLMQHQGQQVRVAARIEEAGEMGRPAKLQVIEIIEAGRPHTATSGKGASQSRVKGWAARRPARTSGEGGRGRSQGVHAYMAGCPALFELKGKHFQDVAMPQLTTRPGPPMVEVLCLVI